MTALINSQLLVKVHISKLLITTRNRTAQFNKIVDSLRYILLKQILKQ